MNALSFLLKMAQPKGSSHKLLSNLSVSFIESAFITLAENSIPVYRRNIDRQRPPVAEGENVSAAAAIILLATGLDYHLCRLKYFRDLYRYKPALPHTPYFNWTIGDSLSHKLERLLIFRKEKRFLAQLTELTVCRDAIVHPKFYTLIHSWDADFNDSTVRAMLPRGSAHRPKTLRNKMQRREFSKVLKLPLVPTWISYIDAVVCVLVVHRFLSLLEWRYGNPYAWVGGITAFPKQTKELFTGWDWQRSHPRELHHWAEAFFRSLSVTHQAKVQARLGGNIKPYISAKRRSVPMKRARVSGLGSIFEERTPRKPDFLFKSPPVAKPKP